jgi:hypothetical protein
MCTKSNFYATACAWTALPNGRIRLGDSASILPADSACGKFPLRLEQQMKNFQRHPSSQIASKPHKCFPTKMLD